MKSGELFAGVGGLSMAVDEVFGTRPAWFAEFDAAPSKVLAHQYPGVPNYGDVTKVDFRTVPHTHVRAGGFPCQDVSLAGRRKGMKDGTRSGLWSEFRRSIQEDRPDWVVIENVRGLLSANAVGDVEPCPWCLGDDQDQHALRALGAVLGDLADLGFDAEWTGLRAADVGAPHGRFRVFILAWPRERTAPDSTSLGWPGREFARKNVEQDGPVPAHAGALGRAEVALLPTPAVVMNDGESVESWSARRERIKATGINGNGMGMPLPIAVQLLPTPDAYSGSRGGSQHPEKRRDGGHTVSLADVAEHKLMPTPRVAATLSSRGTMIGPSKSSMSIEQAAEVAAGILPREFESWDETRLLPTPTVGNATGGNAQRGGDRGDEKLLPGLAVDAASGALMPTPRASRGGSATETMYALGAEREDDERPQGQVIGNITDWGPYAAAIRRWEQVVGRPAPAPVRFDGKGGKPRLNPELTEWMMGWPAGWVTAAVIGLSRAEQLKACGNGVVTRQAIAALREMLARPGVPAVEWGLAA